jgi:L,D-transpeptidase ErfK/SrfK
LAPGWINWWKIAKDNNIDTKKYPDRAETEDQREGLCRLTTGLLSRTGHCIISKQPGFPSSVGLGLLTSKTSTSWKTPLGRFRVIAKEKNPTWYVPPSIQEEMELEGKEIRTSVPPGPDNPLGRFALKTTMPGIMIHETIKPASVNQFRSHGCIRVLPENMANFFEEVELNAPGELLYMPVKAALSDGGRVFLEVHKDFYGRIRNLAEEARMQLEKTGALNKVDWQKVDKVLKERLGTAEDVTL